MTAFRFARRRTARILLALVFTALPWVGGCGESEGIRSYTVAKEVKPEPTDRMLAAIVPAGGQAWFFKVVGPMAAIDKHADEIDKFFSTLRTEGERVRWELPTGWKEEAGTQMRAATILIPIDGKPLDMSVTTLPWSGTEEGLLSNINRWRGQMQLSEIGPAVLAADTREVQAGDLTITVADLRGQFQGGPMMGPFAGGGMPTGTPPVATDRPVDAGAELPAGHPPIDAVGQAATASANDPAPAADAPKFDAAPSWQPLPVQPGGMRKAAFEISSGSEQALVTVFDFPVGASGMADPLLNVNRWRGEVGLSAIQKDELEKIVEPMEIDGEKGRYVKLIADQENPEQSQTKRGTLAAMVVRNDRVWFVKMHGNRDLVASQEKQFKSFLESIRFPADGGADDGN